MWNNAKLHAPNVSKLPGTGQLQALLDIMCKLPPPHWKACSKVASRAGAVCLPCPKKRAKQGNGGASKHKRRVSMRVRSSLSMIHHLRYVCCCPCRSIHKRRKLFYGAPPHPPPTQCCAPFFGYNRACILFNLCVYFGVSACNLKAQRWSCRGNLVYFCCRSVKHEIAPLCVFDDYFPQNAAWNLTYFF